MRACWKCQNWFMRRIFKKIVRCVRNLILLTTTFLLYGKEGKNMMAKLWAIEIMTQETMEGAKEVYGRVPRLLKEKVKTILIESGMEEITQE